MYDQRVLDVLLSNELELFLLANLHNLNQRVHELDATTSRRLGWLDDPDVLLTIQTCLRECLLKIFKQR